VNHEPTKLALLISVICAGASVNALAKADGATDRHGPSQEACAPVRALASPQDWPLILNGIRDAETGSLGLSLPTSAAHEKWLPWREAEAVAVAVAEAVAAVEAIEPTVQKTALHAPEAEPVDPLEAANVAASLVEVVVAAPTSAKSTVAGQHLVEKPIEIDPSRQAVMQPQREELLRGKLVITSSAQRAMRDLAAIRFHALEILETLDSSVNAEVATTASAPTPVPTPSAEVLIPTPSAKVLATLNEVITAPDVAAAVVIDAAHSAADDISLEAAIAARREVKRMKQRVRAEAAAMAQVDTTPTTAPTTTRSNPFGGERVAVRDNALDRVRGGFVSNNLNIAFGIERAVYINGSLVTTTSLNVSDTGRVSGGVTSGVTSGVDSKGLTPGTLALIQSGAGNSVASGAFSSSSGAGLNANAIGTVVQNTLDGQKIQNITVINATANSLGVLRDLNLQNSLRNSLIDSLRR
jgi:hypothetical protein